MPAQRQSKPRTVGSASFDPDDFFSKWGKDPSASIPQSDDQFRSSIVAVFNLKPSDDYVYNATASVTLSQVQQAINHGSAGGLKAWYLYDDGLQKDPPSQADIKAYTDIFASTTSTTKSLTAFAANAKKASTRAAVASHLQSNLHPPQAPLALPPKLKLDKEHKNPYFDLWAWSCRCLDWVGPTPGTAMVRHSHHVLPVLYEHFGCVCPSWDALCVLQQLSKQPPLGDITKVARPLVEIGSGNGYWAFMLRRLGLTVHAVDNEISAWRTTWIGDTIVSDGVAFLSSPPSAYGKDLGKGARNAILLLVYPQVSDNFTGKVINAYEGDTIVVAGTQNGNGFTGFRDETVAGWMARERPEWERSCQIPLPSFAGKDEALFVFGRKAQG